GPSGPQLSLALRRHQPLGAGRRAYLRHRADPRENGPGNRARAGRPAPRRRHGLWLEGLGGLPPGFTRLYGGGPRPGEAAAAPVPPPGEETGGQLAGFRGGRRALESPTPALGRRGGQGPRPRGPAPGGSPGAGRLSPLSEPGSG